ncbi:MULTISPECIES: hypothetical protein [unclassified Chelatococcus]|uniref:hypothetical protein n=1 Tax=unclassified Chelatococcus TaxID=2638111 RepID=UPI001BCB0F68|nr:MULTISPECIES: hypothetical protein [unclassified Chelatococcus]MBS7741458.1 hypothetical protein [Chelatococcus sp. HY11]MBX3544522.1 hypothetical protein [Chelatococcus sp.]MCO5078955.1 hypothetical protein [Chelatococcus sp.]
MKTVHERKAEAEAKAERWERSADRHRLAAERARAKGHHDRAVKHEALHARAFRLLTKAKRAVNRYAPLSAYARGADRLAERIQGATARLNRERKDEANTMRRRRHRREDLHGNDGRIEIGHKDVKDPYEPDKRLRVTINVRESPLEILKSRRRIDDAEYEAGQWFRAVYERASIGPLTAFDPTKEPVDGGGFSDPLSDSTMQASRDLRAILPVVRREGYLLLTSIVGQGQAIAEVAAIWGRTVITTDGGKPRWQKSAEAIVTARLIEALREVAEHRGVAGPRHGLLRAARELGSSDSEAA